MAAAVAVGGLFVLSDGGGDGDEALLVPTQAVVGSSTGATATTTPRPEALRELPPAVWTAIEAEDTEDAGDGNMFLLDLETGQMYSPTAEVLTWDMRADAFISWAATGQIEVGMLGFEGAIEGKVAAYIVDGLGTMRKLPSSGDAGRPSALSSTGTLAYKAGDEVVLFDVDAEEERGRLPELSGSIGAWSADGRYLSFHVSSNSLDAEPPSITVIEPQTGAIIDKVTGEGLVWSNTSHRYLYGAVDPQDPEEAAYELRLRDPDTRSEQAIDGAVSGFLWCPGDRFVVVSLGPRDSDDREDKFTFRIHDVEGMRDVTTIYGAWPAAWLDEDTLSLTGNVCDTYDIYTINTDGTDLRNVSAPGQPHIVAHPSRHGDRIAYSFGDSSGKAKTVVLDVETGETREFATGAARLPFYPGQGSERWSPDDRYLALHVPPGKGGPCEFDPPQRLEVEVH